MALATSAYSLLSPNPRAFSCKHSSPIASLCSLPQTLAVPRSFGGSSATSFRPRPMVAALRSYRKSFVVNALCELPLVGNVAPDFEAEAVFDQEFIKVKLSEYIGKNNFLHKARETIGEGIALRGLFIIDKEGVIQHSTINNLAIGRSVDETLRTLQALQYVQENPDEVCPAGWKPGEKSMKPDPKLSKEYFAAI